MSTVEQIFGAALDAAGNGATAAAGQVAAVLPPAVESPAPPADVGGLGSAEVPTTAPMLHLAQRVMDCFRVNVAYRDSSGVSDKLQYCLDATTCHYSDQQLAALGSIGIPPHLAKKLFTPVTSSKVRAAKSMMVDLVNSVADPLFDVAPSPCPETPREVEDVVVQTMKSELDQLFGMLQQSGGGPLPPHGEALLLKLVNAFTAAKTDEVRTAKEHFARVRTKRMQKKIWDLMVEGGWEKAFMDYVGNVCLYGTGFIVGPVPRVVAANTFREGKNGVRKYTRAFVLKQVYESVSPLDCYPAPDAKEPADGPFCIRVKYSAESLWRFCDAGANREKNGEGWNAATVRGILDRHRNGGVKLLTEPESEAKKAGENNAGSGDSNDCTFEGVRCFLAVHGKDLIELGIVRNRDDKKISMDDYYHVEAIVIDGYTVYCRILDARMEVPISKGVFYDLPGSFWGESIAEKLAFVQTMQNNTGKALFLDLAGTGSMMWLKGASQLVDKSPTATQFQPYKTMAFDDAMFNFGGNGGPPMGVLDIPSKAAALVREWELWQTQADNDSGIPRFAEGQTSGSLGALRTSGGLAQMNEHMMRGMKASMTLTDNGIIKPVAQKTADWILCFDDDMELKGDVFIRPIGLIGRILGAQREQQRLQLLNMVLNSQYLQQLLGPKSVLALMRPSIQDIDINPDDVMPSEGRVVWYEQTEKLKAIAAAESQAPEGGGSGNSPGVAPVEQPSAPGGVAERRSVA